MRERQGMKRNEREREQRDVDGSLSFYLYRNTIWRGRKYVRAMRFPPGLRPDFFVPMPHIAT